MQKHDFKLHLYYVKIVINKKELWKSFKVSAIVKMLPRDIFVSKYELGEKYLFYLNLTFSMCNLNVSELLCIHIKQ